MNKFKLTAAIGLIAALSACSTPQVVSRYAPIEGGLAGDSAAVALRRDYNVVDLRVTVPRDLKVSEANSYYPRADIVWRGDAYGDRYQQVAAIFEEGMTRGAAAFKGSRDVIVDIRVTRFHSLTEKTRYTIGGTHSIKFEMTVRDAKTGEVIEGPRRVSADLDGYGGQRAIEAERAGQTQKVRITDHLAREIQRQLSVPASA
ncbi:hypothetical protein PSA7680_00231 [Pseudoruegeria aquimaris]|uniref:ABC-type transport auxiliary lipoprotein component domain-containing protein n=1 Tax=Pseudoruegeria aquimaris TaxID=393663 RepID=A0A1Y5RAR4_9RHOB|nr:DUF6778 family protein [Pseudoruegeria aquimaris]SLN12963.1 hypothetical protein PSA7680_00231 [Pseudoruegeria aquimaris]